MKLENGVWMEPLPRSFYEPSADRVARALLGHCLLRRTSDGIAGGIIVETEAYLADDPASHSYRGRTPRNRSMFGEPGTAYVYFIYGNHYCFNAACRPEGVGEAVLIRALEPAMGLAWMEARRPGRAPVDWTNGPAKLCQALELDRRLDGVDLADATAEVVLARNPGRRSFLRRHGPVRATPRIGISRSQDRLLRFVLPGNDYVSRRL